MGECTPKPYELALKNIAAVGDLTTDWLDRINQAGPRHFLTTDYADEHGGETCTATDFGLALVFIRLIREIRGQAVQGFFLPVNFSKLILGIYAVLFAAVTLWAAVFFVQMHRDLTMLRAQEAANQRKLAEAAGRLQAQEKYLEQLRHDPALVERLIRQKLGYVKTQEFVFRFDEEKK